jgi:excisionase family DNA binding protein
MADEPLLTVDEVATRLRVHAETIRRWIRAGTLRAISLGPRAGFRIAESDLRAFLDSRKLAA